MNMLRTGAQTKVLRTALQMLGNLYRFGISFFDFDSVENKKTTTEVLSDNSELMRNIGRHEHQLEKTVVRICRVVMTVERSLGVILPDAGNLRMDFDDLTITDTSVNKQQEMEDVAT